MKRESKGGHSRWKASGSGADELSKVDEHLLVQPEGGLGAQIRDSQEETRSLNVSQVA